MNKTKAKIPVEQVAFRVERLESENLELKKRGEEKEKEYDERIQRLEEALDKLLYPDRWVALPNAAKELQRPYGDLLRKIKNGTFEKGVHYRQRGNGTERISYSINVSRVEEFLKRITG